MKLDRTTRKRSARLTTAGRRTAGVLTALALAATVAVAPSPASADTSKNPARIGLFGSTDATYDGVYRQSLSLVALDAALEELGRLDPRRAQVVEHRIFAGLSTGECSRLLGISTATVERDWRAARAWLAVEMGSSHGDRGEGDRGE